MGFFDFKRKKAVGEKTTAFEAANENLEEDAELVAEPEYESEYESEEEYLDGAEYISGESDYYEPVDIQEEEEADLSENFLKEPESAPQIEEEIADTVELSASEETDFLAKSNKAAAPKKTKEQRKDAPKKTEEEKMQLANIERLSIENLEKAQAGKDEVLTAVEDSSYRIQEGLDENMTVLERSIGANADKILEAIKNTTVGGVNDLDDMSRLQYFKNLKISLLSFVLSIFAGFMIISSLLSLVKLMNMDGPIELILIDYIFVGLFSVGSILLSLYQKKCFSKSRSLREYLVSKSQVDSVARCALWIVIGVLIVAFFVMLAISIGIIVKYA